MACASSSLKPQHCELICGEGNTGFAQPCVKRDALRGNRADIAALCACLARGRAVHYNLNGVGVLAGCEARSCVVGPFCCVGGKVGSAYQNAVAVDVDGLEGCIVGECSAVVIDGGEGPCKFGLQGMVGPPG